MSTILLELQHPGSTSSLPPFVIPAYAKRVNCYLFAGLFTSMIVAFLSILVKQWARSYQRDLAGVSSPHLCARIRHFRYYGIKRWHFADIVGLLSIIMHFALFISAVGIIDLLLSTAPAVIGYVPLGIFLVGIVFFIITTILPLVVPDAPFRSPLSKLLTNIKIRILKSQLISWGKKETVEEGLEDHLDQSQGSESEENSIVRTQFHLDLDILCHLLGEADKSTERWLLDLCFEKLPQLTLLEKKDPQRILTRKIIIEVYIFLAKGCVGINKNGETEAEPTRLHRARKLCEFLTWFLSLKRGPDVKDVIRQLLTGNGFDPTVLPKALAKDDNNTASVTRAYSALGRLEHLLEKDVGPEDGPDCVACAAMYTKLERALQESSDSTTSSSASALASQKSRLVTTFLIQRMDCLLGWDKRENIENIQWNVDQENMKMRLLRLEKEIRLLQLGFEKCAPTDNNKKIWEKALKEKDSAKDLVSELLKEVWFVPLMDTLKSLQITRTHTPIWKNPNPNSNTNSPSNSNFSSPTTSRPASNLLGTSRFGGTRERDTRSQAVSFNGSPAYSNPNSGTPTPTFTVPTNNFP